MEVYLLNHFLLSYILSHLLIYLLTYCISLTSFLASFEREAKIIPKTLFVMLLQAAFS